jgi:hypothetical protein
VSAVGLGFGAKSGSTHYFPINSMLESVGNSLEEAEISTAAVCLLLDCCRSPSDVGPSHDKPAPPPGCVGLMYACEKP